jgi:hypothetical protein
LGGFFCVHIVRIVRARARLAPIGRVRARLQSQHFGGELLLLHLRPVAAAGTPAGAFTPGQLFGKDLFAAVTGATRTGWDAR